ncbi:MAG: PEP/pyruvate-binding domain-containing protein [Syntrophorhabdales bacterium]|jgi:pyruvate,water dikinase
MEQSIFWFEELGQEQNELVGKKCANLGELSRLGLRIPYGFALSVKAFEQFMRLTGADLDLKSCVDKAKDDLGRIEECLNTSAKARDILESKSMPADMEREIRGHYRELCHRTGKENLAVAVRSSGAVSMPGQMETYLNIIGEDDVVSHIKKVWSSAYTARAITFRLGQHLPLEWAPIGVAVMALIDAKAAGVVLTVLPTVGDTTKVVIEGNWGLGESVVSGEITPDSFIVDKASLEILDRKIAHKTGMVQSGASGTLYQGLTEDLSDRPCLDDAEIKEIARTAVQVEEHFGLPQDMEWVVDRTLPTGRNVFWVQTRPARYTKVEAGDKIDYLIDLMAALFN